MTDKHIKILLIEDNPGDVRLIQEMLSEASGVSFDLECAGRFSTGLERFAEGGIDVVLLDLGLPDSRGLETFTKVHAQVPEVPIVVLTGLNDATLAIKAVQEGAQDYLVKGQVGSNLLVRSVHYAIERKRAEKHIRHLNSVLRAIRTVNQLIVAEKDRDSLLRRACDALIETRGYDAVWLGFLRDGETFATVVGSDFGDDVSRFCERVMGGDHPPCIRNALAQKERVVIVDKSSVCGDCFFKSAGTGKEAAIIRVEHAGRLLGLLAILFAADVAADDEERELLKEVAGDIALGLHNMELEEAHKQAEAALKEYSERLEEMVEERTAELRESEEKMRAQYKGIPVPTYSWQRVEDDLVLVDYNDAAVAITQGRIADFVGITVSEMYRDMPEIRNEIKRCFDEKTTIEREMSYWYKSTGEHKYLAVKYAFVPPDLVLVHTEDITERKEMQERLVRSEKLAVLGQLAGGVSHELRNPLGAIKNAVYFLNMALQEPEPEVKETLEILEKEVGTSERIISSLLEFARPKPPTRRQVDINDVVREALSRTTVPESVEVVSQLDERLPLILADPDQLGQVFGNIVLNGIQAMPEGGRLTVKTSEVSGRLPKSGWVAVSFTDTGVGIPKENLEKIFEPLFTTKAKGIGLGLALVKMLVEGHGGSIEVESPSTLLRAGPSTEFIPSHVLPVPSGAEGSEVEGEGEAEGLIRTGDVGKGSTFTVRLPLMG